MDLTPRQADVILLIRNHRHLHGYSPSIREMAATLGLSRGAIMGHVKRLVAKGKLHNHPGFHRTLEVVEDIQGVVPAPPKRDRLATVQARLDKLRSAS